MRYCIGQPQEIVCGPEIYFEEVDIGPVCEGGSVCVTIHNIGDRDGIVSKYGQKYSVILGNVLSKLKVPVPKYWKMNFRQIKLADLWSLFFQPVTEGEKTLCVSSASNERKQCLL